MDILLVEDNPGDARLVLEAFTEVDIEVTFDTVSDGYDALEYLGECADDAAKSFPTLILLDLNLPRMDGFAVLEALEDDPDVPPLPVLVLTSSKAEEDIVRSYESSANAYLTKPETHEEFVSLARAVEDFWIGTARLPSVPS